MDPITAAIIAAVAAGVAKVGGQAVEDAYNGLKELIKRKFGGESKVAKAVEAVQADPESKGQQMVLQEQMQKAKADQDAQLVKAAQALLAQLKAKPGGEQIVQTAIGDQNIQVAGDQNQINVNRP